MITLAAYEEKYREALENYSLSEEQLLFTRHPLEMLERSEQILTYTPIVILEDKQVSGFFVLDSGQDKYHYTDEPESILLRSYSIHPDFQGRGIAKISIGLIAAYTTEHFPKVNQIVLGVDEANKVAQAVYLKAGFIDEGRRFNGRSGAQMAMCLKLH